MTARFATMNHASHCCTGSAAATSSARIRSIMDTAVLLVVSIIIALRNVRLRAAIV